MSKFIIVFFFLLSSFFCFLPPSVFAFSDVSADSPYKAAIDYFVQAGVIKGCTAKRFCTDYPLNRAEATKIFVLASGVTVNGDYRNCFKDVHEEWYAKYICYAKEQGLVKGYADNTFRPGQVVNRAEAIKMALQARSINVETAHYTSIYSDVAEKSWYYKYVTWAAFHNLLSENAVFGAAEPRHRGEFALTLYRLVTVQELRKTVYNTELDSAMVGRALRPANSPYFTDNFLCSNTGGTWGGGECKCALGRLWQPIEGCHTLAGNVGAVCGGIAALPCSEGLVCRQQFSYPDASGECVVAEKPTTITAAELKQGWYYGFSDQKKLGTPDNWIWVGGGKESKWQKPAGVKTEG